MWKLHLTKKGGDTHKHPERQRSPCPPLSLANLACPALYALAATAHLDPRDDDARHSGSVGKPLVSGHASCVGALLWDQLEHWQQKVGELAGLLVLEVVLFAQHVGETPVAQAVYVAQLALAVEDLLAPFPGHAERLGEVAEQLNNLRNVVIVLAVARAGLGVEQVVSRDEFKNLEVLVLDA